MLQRPQHTDPKPTERTLRLPLLLTPILSPQLTLPLPLLLTPILSLQLTLPLPLLRTAQQ